MPRNGTATPTLQANDPRLHERIRGRLGASPFQIVDLETHVEGDHVTLRGRVTSYYAKQIVQALVLPLPGVGRLSNELVVQSAR